MFARSDPRAMLRYEQVQRWMADNGFWQQVFNKRMRIMRNSNAPMSAEAVRRARLEEFVEARLKQLLPPDKEIHYWNLYLSTQFLAHVEYFNIEFPSLVDCMPIFYDIGDVPFGAFMDRTHIVTFRPAIDLRRLKHRGHLSDARVAQSLAVHAINAVFPNAADDTVWPDGGFRLDVAYFLGPPDSPSIPDEGPAEHVTTPKLRAKISRAWLLAPFVAYACLSQRGEMAKAFVPLRVRDNWTLSYEKKTIDDLKLHGVFERLRHDE
jgi:hypothetical protein